tara:strand:- start:1513 stop:2088 length:576 start_codon:yes stop_codon:yes gene_type:complete
MILNRAGESDLSEVFVKAIQKKFNIIALLDINYMDHDWDILKDILVATRKSVYEPKDRYVIVHTDTDYYLPGCPYGFSIFNLVRTFLHNNIPLYTMLLVTDHKGIKKEFKILIPKEMHEHNFPTIVDDCLTSIVNTRIGMNQEETHFKESEIVKHGVSMMGVPRVHRNMLYNQLREKNLLDAYAVAYKGED